MKIKEKFRDLKFKKKKKLRFYEQLMICNNLFFINF
jgi:hypothetical protein